MSNTQLVNLGLLILSGTLLLRLAPAAIRSWLVYSGTGQRRQQDATRTAPEPRPDVAERMDEVAYFGYHAIGTTRLELPVGERFARILTANDGESYAIVVDGTTPLIGMSAIYSAWPDGQWLGTMHPRGQPLDRPNLKLRVVTTTLEDAISEHREAVARMRATHGAPKRIERMADMLMLDADYRLRFGGRELRRITFRAIAPALLTAALTILSIVLLVVAR